MRSEDRNGGYRRYDDWDRGRDRRDDRDRSRDRYHRRDRRYDYWPHDRDRRDYDDRDRGGYYYNYRDRDSRGYEDRAAGYGRRGYDNRGGGARNRDYWNRGDDYGDRWNRDRRDYRRYEASGDRYRGGSRDKRRSRSRSGSSRSGSGRSADSEGHISSEVQQITERFNVARELDRGTFGAVFKAFDNKHSEYVAVKVVRKVKRYVEDAEVEVSIMEKLSNMDKVGKHCVRFLKSFHFQEHYCIVTELLGSSLYHALKKLRGKAGRDELKGVGITTLVNVSRQLCEAMQFLKEAELVHADLKTENVLLQHADMSLLEDHPKVKLIDFGAATWEKGSHGSIIQTRHYRAPEVVLGLPWSYPCDMWSVACIILELHEGILTFDTHDTGQHLAMMEKLCGPVPRSMARKADNTTKKMFDTQTDQLLWPEISGGVGRSRDRKAEEEVQFVRPLWERVPKEGDTGSFLSFLQGMFALDPSERFTPEKALSHAFLEVASNDN